MASLAQVAGQYVFFLFNADGIGANPASGWVLLVGVLWIVAMTYVAYQGIELSASFQKALLSIELVMLLVLSTVALVKVGQGHPGSIPPSRSWFNPFEVTNFSAFASGIIFMVFIYWGWDTGVAVNEETKDRNRTPGLGRHLVYRYPARHLRAGGHLHSGFCRDRFHGNRPWQPGQRQRRALGPGFCHLRLLRLRFGLHPSAADGPFVGRGIHSDDNPADGSDDPVDGGLQGAAGLVPENAPPLHDADRIHDRHGGVSIALYAAMNYMSSGALVIADAVITIGLFIAFYYGLTGFACAWYYRKNLTSSARNLWMQGILPVAGRLMLYFLGGWSVWLDYNVATENDYTMWTVPGLHWQAGGAFVIAVIAVLVGLACYIYCRITRPAFFTKQTLTRATPTLTPDPSLPEEAR